MKATINKFTITIGVAIGLLLVIGFFGIPYLYNEYAATNPMQTLPFADGHGNRLHITNNRSAVNPTFDLVLAFLQKDDTNSLATSNLGTDPGPMAVRLHDHAEKAGIRTGVVELQVPGEDSIYPIDVFNTTDKGPIMVDPMGSPMFACPWTIVHMDNNNPHNLVFVLIRNQSVAYLADTGNVSGVGAVTSIKANIKSYTW